MSATINQEQFSNYFGGAPCIEIPGCADSLLRSLFPPPLILTFPLTHSFTHPVVDHYLESYLPRLLSTNAYRPSGKPARKATQAQLDRMRESYIERGVGEGDLRALMALETATRSEKIDFGLVGATVCFVSFFRPINKGWY
jgi:ATP-dependent RNA helicase DHX57